MIPAPKIKWQQLPGLKLQAYVDEVGARGFERGLREDDMEPIQKTMSFLNESKDLVAMIPIDSGDREKLDKSMSAILKFAAGIPCPLVPFASTSLKKYKLGKAIKIKVLEPVNVDPKIKRDARHAMASDLVDQILAVKSELEVKEEEPTPSPQPV